jgi:sRNA-binding carbon storage regulator CsrA
MPLTAGPGAASTVAVTAVVSAVGAMVPIAVAAPEEGELCRKEKYSE